MIFQLCYILQHISLLHDGLINYHAGIYNKVEKLCKAWNFDAV